MYLAGSGTDDLLSILQANKRRTNYPHFYSNQRLYPHHDVFLYKVVPSPSIPDTARTERGLTKSERQKEQPYPWRTSSGGSPGRKSLFFVPLTGTKANSKISSIESIH